MAIQSPITFEFPGCTATLHCADCVGLLPKIEGIAAIVSDPPYGMKWKSDRRFTSNPSPRFGRAKLSRSGVSHPPIVGDKSPFDPSPLLALKLPLVLWGVNHFWSKLPPGSLLVWLKRSDRAFGSFLSDADAAFSNRGRGLYAKRLVFLNRGLDAALPKKQHASIHPNQKPVAIMQWSIERLKVKRGETVCDPYMGSGTTGIAAVRMGINFVGIEKDRRHFKTAAERFGRELERIAAQ